MAADNDIKITLSLDATGAVQQFNVVGDALKETRREVEGTEGGFSRFQATIVTLQSGLSLVGQAFGAVSGAARSVFSALERGSAVDDVAEAFSRLSTSAGTTADVFLSRLNAATGETIDNFTLQKQAIESLRAGTKPDEFVELTKAARALAQQTGGSTLDELNKLSQAFETGRARALQNSLGVLDLKRAEEELAAQLGVTREQLSAEGQVQAARNAILEAARKKTAEVGEISKGVGDNIATLGKIVDDTKDKFFKAVGTNQELNRALAELGRALKQIDFAELITGISWIVTNTVKAVSAITSLTKSIFTFGTAANAAFGGGPLGAVVNYFTRIRAETQATEKAFLTAGKTLSEDKLFNGALSAALQKIEQSSVAAGDDLRGLSGAMNELFVLAEASASATDTVATSTEALSANLSDVNITARQAREAVDQYAEALKRIADPRDAKGFGGPPSVNDKKGGGGSSYKVDWVSILFGAGNALAGSGDVFAGGGDKTEEVKKMVSGVSRAVAAGFTMGISELVVAALGEEFFIELANYTMGFRIIEKLFGADKQRMEREALDKFFADVFAAEPVFAIVNGELVKLTDLVVQGITTVGEVTQEAFRNGTFDDFLQSLPAEVQQGFAGVAQGFEGLLGLSEDVGGQIAAIFANNVGGSLNNLQLLVQASGKSFEELRQAVVDAFLDGKISALEAQTAMNGIAQVAQKGIPDAVGDVAGAFENLKEAGTRGGRASVDALQDIAFEARELGKNTIPEVMDYLVEIGAASREEVEQLFAALAAAGITTLEQLENAKPDQLIGALSQLEAQKFPFEEAVEDVDELISKINELPDEIEKKLVFKIETRADRQGEQALNVATSAGNGGEAIN